MSFQIPQEWGLDPENGHGKQLHNQLSSLAGHRALDLPWPVLQEDCILCLQEWEKINS